MTTNNRISNNLMIKILNHKIIPKYNIIYNKEIIIKLVYKNNYKMTKIMKEINCKALSKEPFNNSKLKCK
jgi:hypothetical protein